MRAGAVFNLGGGGDTYVTCRRNLASLRCSVGFHRQQLGTANLREPGRLEATAGSKQIHRIERYVKVCPSLSLSLELEARRRFYFFPQP